MKGKSADYEKKYEKARFFVSGDDVGICIGGLSDYTITGFAEGDIVIQELAEGKTVVIDGTKGLILIDDENAFDKVSLWKFPVLKTGENTLTFSDNRAKVKVRYHPMWI